MFYRHSLFAACIDLLYFCRGIQAFEDPVVVEMLQSGIVKPPPDDNDRLPRAAG